jgi:transcriptional regulator with XRE-family HTH domain
MARPVNIIKKCAGNILLYRTKSKLSQADVAKKVGISVSYVSMLERGERSPPLEVMAAIARAIKVQPFELIK